MRRGLVCLALPVALAGCGMDGGEPTDWERMTVQPRIDAYESAAPLTADSGMARPPLGTVPHGSGPILAPGAEGSTSADLPVALTRADLERGRERFGIFCAPCHGIDGGAATPVAQAMQMRRPPSLLLPRLRAASATHIHGVIRDGYGLMPSYAARLDVDDRWRVVGYVRALQLASHARLEALPPDARARARSALPPDPRAAR